MIGTRSTTRAKYVSLRDPAVDRDAPAYDFGKFWEGGGDMAHLPLKPGCEPTVFELERLSVKQYIHCDTQPDRTRTVLETVAYALKGVTNFRRGGEVVTLEWQRTDIGERLKDAVIEKLFAPELFVELWQRAQALNALDPTLGQE